MPQFDSGAAEQIGRFSEGLLLRLLQMFLIYGVGAAICGLLAAHGASIAFLPFVAVVGAAGFRRRAGQQDGSGT
jgi:hypothetical protein